MKFFHLTDIDIELYELIGFDLDGTLYDERLFIQQAYRNIANHLNLSNVVYEWMLNRWDEKGSSYPFIFSEVITHFQITSVDIEEMVGIYRTTNPILHLSPEIIQFISQIPLEKLFLVTDGNSILQRRKYNSLNLQTYFSKENSGFTGDLGVDFYKPNIEITRYLKCFQEKKKKVLYLGDRYIDEQFAKNAHFDFAYVQHFKEFWGTTK